MLRYAARLSFSILLLLPLVSAVSQINNKGDDAVYGFDPTLYNGRFYTYQVPKNAKGSPFLTEDFCKGSLTIMGRTYDGLELNYDIYNQLLLLKYTNHEGATNILEIPWSWLEKFSLGRAEFELSGRETLKPVVYQLFRSGDIKVQYFWKKELTLENVFGTSCYVFSDPRRQQMISVNLRNVYYNKNKEFIRAFDPSIQVKLSNYLKINKIKVIKATDTVISGLVNFCNTLIYP